MSLPLAGTTILDLTHVLAGPFCSLTLADLGAKVIKVERPGTGDDTRSFPPFKDGKSAYFAAINHSKKSIALDLKSEADRAVFDKLLERSDVLLENNRPGVMERLGYGWDTVHSQYPSMVYGSVSGFGQTGPDAKRPAYDMVVQARGGVMSITGEKGRDPVRVGASIGDIVAGMYLAQGILAALLDRTRTGKGRRIDISMLDAQVTLLEHAIALTTVSGKAPGPTGARHPSIAPFETFHASDGLFVIACGNDVLFEKLCLLLDLPISNDPRFATNPERVKNTRLLKRLIEAVTLENTKSFWIAKMTAAGIPTGPIQSVDQVLRDPQILARNMVVDVLDKNGRAAFTAAGNPIKMSGSEDRTTRTPAPDLDGNRGEILRWLDGS
ncbi:CaiB/BaiF CoA transferase family protein [Puniceibacterium sediminis]|uniref:CoA:oxalate CoA-transferase n=1 Tax=Puniceibacterium sediminis TaxID=1608407 RepID=A0A238XFD4_9RHOB|nr:CaiB/BaiF CoA-transferase family protein [Puniceibacterium sediminis]SNR57715.1 CoA:oxalate CoA-transferase [Puniceibacterium sediminis]